MKDFSMSKRYKLDLDCRLQILRVLKALSFALDSRSCSNVLLFELMRLVDVISDSNSK